MMEKRKIRDIIEEKGIKIKFLAKKVGFTPTYFSKKIDDPEDFSLKEAKLIADFLNEDMSNIDFGIDI